MGLRNRPNRRAMWVVSLLGLLASVLVGLPATAQPDDRTCTITGTEKNDWILGTDENDVICAGAGDDVIVGLDGDDIIFSGPGNDIIDATADSVEVVDFDDKNDVVTGAALAITASGKKIPSNELSVGELIEKRGLIESLNAVSKDLPIFDTAPDESPEPTIREFTEEQWAYLIESREDLGFSEPTDPGRLRDEATANGSPETFGAALLDMDLEIIDKRYEAGNLLDLVRQDLEAVGLVDGHFVDSKGNLVFNLSPGTSQPDQDLLKLFGATEVVFKPVAISREDLTAEAVTVTTATRKIFPNGQIIEQYYPTTQSAVLLVLAPAPARSGEAALEQVEALDATSDHVTVELDTSEDTAQNTDCDAEDCYAYMPGMRVGGCTAGWIVMVGGSRRMLTSGHCSNLTHEIKDGADSSREIDMQYIAGSEHKNDPTGYDHQLLRPLETANRGGAASLNGMNAVLTGDPRHSMVVLGSRTSYDGMTVCKTGYVAQSFGFNIECGVVSGLGALNTTNGGSVTVPGAGNCKGDSGGPVWEQSTTIRRAVGIIRGRFGDNIGGTATKCSTSLYYVDLNRALADLGATFMNPSGHENSRRAAIRYYDVFFDREPDAGGYSYWDSYCNLTYMRDMAFVFTVSQKTEFANRFPLTGAPALTNSKKRVDYLYWGLLDRSASANTRNVWGGTIWGTASRSEWSREATYDWLAWAMITSQGSPGSELIEFSTTRMSTFGDDGAPPMCQGHDWSSYL